MRTPHVSVYEDTMDGWMTGLHQYGFLKAKTMVILRVLLANFFSKYSMFSHLTISISQINNRFSPYYYFHSV